MEPPAKRPRGSQDERIALDLELRLAKVVRPLVDPSVSAARAILLGLWSTAFDLLERHNVASCTRVHVLDVLPNSPKGLFCDAVNGVREDSWDRHSLMDYALCVGFKPKPSSTYPCFARKILQLEIQAEIDEDQQLAAIHRLASMGHHLSMRKEIGPFGNPSIFHDVSPLTRTALKLCLPPAQDQEWKAISWCHYPTCEQIDSYYRMYAQVIVNPDLAASLPAPYELERLTRRAKNALVQHIAKQGTKIDYFENNREIERQVRFGMAVTPTPRPQWITFENLMRWKSDSTSWRVVARWVMKEFTLKIPQELAWIIGTFIDRDLVLHQSHP